MDKEKREKRNIIILTAVTLLLLVALTVGWYFVLVKNVTVQREAAQRDYEARKTIADRLEKAQVDQRKAEDRLVEVSGQLQFFRRFYRSLEFGAMGTDPATETDAQKTERARTWRLWLREYFSDYADAFTATLDAKARQSGVSLDRSIKVANPPQTPEDVVPPPNGFLKPAQGSGNSQGGTSTASITPIATTSPTLGAGGGAAAASSGGVAVRATGTLKQLIDFFQRLNNSPILMVVQNIKLDSSTGASNNQNGSGTTGLSTIASTAGQSNRRPAADGLYKVTASFNLVPYLLARGAGAPITSGGGASASSAPSTSVSDESPTMTTPGGSNGVTP